MSSRASAPRPPISYHHITKWPAISILFPITKNYTSGEVQKVWKRRNFFIIAESPCFLDLCTPLWNILATSLQDDFFIVTPAKWPK